MYVLNALFSFIFGKELKNYLISTFERSLHIMFEI
jgi:hypothetical protein